MTQNLQSMLYDTKLDTVIGCMTQNLQSMLYEAKDTVIECMGIAKNLYSQ